MRVASTSERLRKKVKESSPIVQERLASYGQAQLVFHGEQDNQEVICWFAEPEMTARLTVGQEVVVRGRFEGEIVFPLQHFTDKGAVEADGGFSYNLIDCRILPK
ncbi:hypothetical protein [Lignipirellula cremea]|uniref:Uncharacterized protein n=1 Tax=Lignipirellula cremea TaxID=2528010 RepID=A0A518E2R5_9BACT|nr:hypothetical protein [Lignipirellula cremea]QDU98353.1 hypothetical protein Pla8534_62200 [Lignipirellula cremea]